MGKNRELNYGPKFRQEGSTVITIPIAELNGITSNAKYILSESSQVVSKEHNETWRTIHLYQLFLLLGSMIFIKLLSNFFFSMRIKTNGVPFPNEVKMRTCHPEHSDWQMLCMCLGI